MAEAATDVSGPWVNLKIQDDEYSRLFSAMPEGCVEGLSANVNGAGTAFVLNTGYAVMKGRLARVTASKTIAPASPPGSGSRIDRLVVRFDISAGTARAMTLSGTASTGPSLTRTDTVFDIPIARALIRSGAPQVSQIIDERTPVPRGVIPKGDIVALNAQAMALGQMAVSPTIGWLRYYDGSLFRSPMLHQRVAYTPAWTMQNAAGAKRGSYLRIDQNLMWAEGSILASTGASMGTGEITVSLPTASAANPTSGPSRYVGEAWWSRGTGGALRRLIVVAGAAQSTAGIYMADGQGLHIRPGAAGLSWLPGDVITFNLVYPVAGEG